MAWSLMVGFSCVAGAPLAPFAPLSPFAPPGRFGVGLEILGGGGRFMWWGAVGEASCGGPRRVEVVPQPVEVVRRVTRLEAAQLGVQREAIAELHAAVDDARVEAVERAHRRAAGDLALGVVDAAVAGADELLRGLDVAHRAAQVSAAGGDRDVGQRLDVLVAVARADVLRRRLANVHGGLAGLTDGGVHVNHALDVARGVELALRADVLPLGGDGVPEHRAQREAERREAECHGGYAAHGERTALHQAAARDGLALDRARDAATLRIAGLALGVHGGTVGHESLEGFYRSGSRAA